MKKWGDDTLKKLADEIKVALDLETSE